LFSPADFVEADGVFEAAEGDAILSDKHAGPVSRRITLAGKNVAAFGAWKSPITPDLIVAETIMLREVAVDGADIYWLEQRPTEGGRYVVVRRTPDRRTSDVTPPGFNARTTVHEYGGGPYLPADGVLYFSNFADQ